jgi:primase-polymerase (primpol)-like protein
MDGKGRALDNIFTERLWRMVKYEEVHLQSYSTPREARQGLARYQHGGWDGLGFAFSFVAPYCGNDLDNCREPETGEIAP